MAQPSTDLPGYALPSDFDLDAFLAQPLMAHLATASEAGPRDSPVWYLWEDGAIWLVGNTRDTFPTRIERDARCAVGIVEFDLARGLLRHVGIRGVGAVERLDHDRVKRLLRRYLGADEAGWNRDFKASVIDRLELMVRIQPTSIVARDQSYFSSVSPRGVGRP